MTKAQLFDTALNFYLPQSLEKAQPTETRDLPRDAVKLMVSWKDEATLVHTQFGNIAEHLRAGDVLVVNTSGTINAALDVLLPNGQPGRIHLSTRIGPTEWWAEIRVVKGPKTLRFHQAKTGLTFSLPDGGSAQLLAPFYDATSDTQHLQLWKIKLLLPTPIEAYLEQHGQPIQYDGLDQVYPTSYYQTVFSQTPGSAEMPSAGRGFTPELVTQLVAKGVQFAPVLLHTGVSSLEVGEAPYPEYAEVSQMTARLINRAKAEGRRIIAIGTTAVRAIEAAIDSDGFVQAFEGLTDVVITPARGMKVVTGLLTGFHEPRASHLLMLEALIDRRQLSYYYQAAITRKYQWHEFGDLHLILA